MVRLPPFAPSGIVGRPPYSVPSDKSRKAGKFPLSVLSSNIPVFHLRQKALTIREVLEITLANNLDINNKYVVAAYTGSFGKTSRYIHKIVI